jgi:hypothetical protein
LPAAALHVWKWFAELDAARNGNGYAADNLSFTEIGEWAALRRVSVRDWELTALVRMDKIRVGMLNAAEPEAPRVSDRPMTPKLFTALFGG